MATLGTLLAPDLIQTGSCWQLCADVNGYSRSDGESLTTQACRGPVSYTHLRAHETGAYLVCRLLLEKKKDI